MPMIAARHIRCPSIIEVDAHRFEISDHWSSSIPNIRILAIEGPYDPQAERSTTFLDNGGIEWQRGSETLRCSPNHLIRVISFRV